MRHLTFALAAAGLAATLPTIAATPRADPSVAKAIASSARSPENRARDRYRHPAETLAFFGVKPGQSVVEFIPSGGWYSEILAPLEAKGGSYTALVSARGLEGANKLFADKARFPGATVATYDAGAGTTSVPDGSADVVVTFRNVHNLIMAGGDGAANMFKAFYKALKPGGTLGVEDHRLPENKDQALEQKTGYIKRSTVLRLAQQAGFKLAGESQVNANPKDTHDWPEGVWTLPPTYRLKDQDRAKYAAIGESDRMTLKFVKPKSWRHPGKSRMTTAYDFTVKAADGSPQPLDAYRGRVLLIVNTASKCGFTPQYGGLEALFRNHADDGLTVIGFPCNQFGAQEPGDAEEIRSFCTLTYDVGFPLMAKIDVNGPTADPLYAWLKAEAPGLLGSRAIKWNFTKFLVGRDGRVIDRYAPTTKPEALEADIARALTA